MTRWARIFVSSVLFFPFIMILIQIDQWSLPSAAETWSATYHSLVQASLSATASVAFGILAALGLLKMNRWRRFLELVFIAPSFFPALFVILACLQVFRPFPFGIAGIVLVHTIVYLGLCTVVLASLIEAKIGGVAELALIEGASRFQFFKRGAWPILMRDIFGLWLFVFVACLTSFAIPLIVGGTELSTLEVLIYEKAVVESNLSQAVGVGLFQSLLVFGLLSLFRSPETIKQSKVFNLSILGIKGGLAFPLLASLIVTSGIVAGVLPGIRQMQKLNLGWVEILEPLLGTLVVGLGVGLLTLSLLLAAACGFPHRRFEALMKTYIAPSTALTGLALLSLGGMSLSGQTDYFIVFKIIVGLSLLMLTALYRLRLGSSLEGLRSQWETAQSLGAGSTHIFRRIVLPQILPEAMFLAGVAAFWSCGDFALSGFFAGDDLTLALVADSLLGSYRLEAASALSILLLLVGSVCFYIFWRLGDVYRKKLIS